MSMGVYILAKIGNCLAFNSVSREIKKNVGLKNRHPASSERFVLNRCFGENNSQNSISN